jgi:hypothetical protein
MMATPDERYAAKVAGRANGTVPIFTPEPQMPKGQTQEVLSERFQWKLAQRANAATVAAADAKAKAEAESKAAAADAKADEPKPKAEKHKG